ncbi:helix-turn-helix domain-containing protein [Micromonospora sp. NPDC049366]|uniref:helix-turn-helix domain-containing protein n=1 Tax=Micromonospora sp. NPDC049366 TaxID=3364271 RepID=UPI0037B193D7
MPYDPSTMTPGTRAVLDALVALGQGTAHELSERSGKARSTTDRAIKTLADAGLIVAVGTDADTTDGTPTRWAPSERVAAETQERDVSTDAEPGADKPDGAEDDTPTGETDASDTDRVEAGQADDDAGSDHTPPGGEPSGADVGPHPAEVGEGDGDSHDPGTVATDDDTSDADKDSDGSDAKDRVTVVQPSRPGDRKVMTIKAVLSEHGDDGATIGEIVAESGIGETTAARLLTAMEQADAARLLPGVPRRWIAGPTKASEVDPNPAPPRCPLCLQVVKGLSASPDALAQVQHLVRPDATLHIVAADGTVHAVALPTRPPTRTPGMSSAGSPRTDATVNTDGSQPFARGELERLTFETLKANPGRTMTPQEITVAISAQLGGRAVSSGAVRNNCGKLGAAGRIVMVSESPWAFQYPAQADDGATDQSNEVAAGRS